MPQHSASEIFQRGPLICLGLCFAPLKKRGMQTLIEATDMKKYSEMFKTFELKKKKIHSVSDKTSRKINACRADSLCYFV